MNEEIDGIRVHRIWTYIAPNRGRLRRIINYLSYVPTAVWRGLRIPRPDVLVATSPQFFVAVAGWVVAKFRRVPWVFELRDLWPESIVAVGAMKPSLVVRMLEKLELHLYNSATQVIVLTHAFGENLVKRGIAKKKIAFVPNGVMPGEWGNGDRLGTRREFRVQDNVFVVSYIGTVGMAHGIGTILEAARLFDAERDGYCFWIVGDGAEREDLQAKARLDGLNTVHFMGLMPREKVADILAGSDACAVLLKRSDLFKTVLPSKMFEAMAAGRPIILGVAGEARDVLERARAGIGITPEDADGLVRAVRELKENPGLARQLGENGRKFVATEYSRRGWAGVMLKALEEVAAHGHGG